ncbi:MAG: heparinase II/III family protein [Spirochaetales bacterium]|nr:heparinase II/III family protein [Spirochaetales bacterium]
MKIKPLYIIIFLLIILLFPGCESVSRLTGPVPFNNFPPEEVQKVIASLPEFPRGVGIPISNRTYWDKLRDGDFRKSVITRAEQYLNQPLPEITDELYRDYSKTGNRTNWERVSANRRGRIRWYTLAECLENKGRFLPAIKELFYAICQEKTWVMPAHDGDLSNYKGKRSDIDLGSSMLAWELATALYLLDPVIDRELSVYIGSEIQRRVLDPYIKMIEGEISKNWWLSTTNNWNAVCLAGVTGAALATISSKEVRGLFILWADRYIMNFLKGFTKDGYCSEGLGYWNYGFGHFLMLSETVYQATDGNVNFFKKEQALAPAFFGKRVKIINNVYPAFADSSVTVTPSGLVMYHVNKRFHIDLPGWETCDPVKQASRLYETALYAFPFPVETKTSTPHESPPSSLQRDWFEDAGVLLCRPGPDSPSTLGAAIKGGNNDEHHNHNDVGSFVVVSGNTPVIFDPGAEVYTKQTFGPARYKSDLLNSFGHDVPVVAGKLQRTGAKAKATIVATEFSDDRDTLVLDLTAAYKVSSLEQLTRKFIYSREVQGFVTITDTVRFSSHHTFGTALIIPGSWKQIDETTLLIFTLEQAVKVNIETGEIPFIINTTLIKEQSVTNVQATRIGIELKDPVKDAFINLSFFPAAHPFAEKGTLANGGFEYSGLGWSLGNNNMAFILTDKKATGDTSLKIEDLSETEGSNILSGAVMCLEETRYVLSGIYYPLSGNGIGLYVKFYNSKGDEITQINDKGWIEPVGTLGGSDNTWKNFSFSFTSPSEAGTMKIWIHSFNKSVVSGYLDDIIVEVDKK